MDIRVEAFVVLKRIWQVCLLAKENVDEAIVDALVDIDVAILPYWASISRPSYGIEETD